MPSRYDAEEDAARPPNVTSPFAALTPERVRKDLLAQARCFESADPAKDAAAPIPITPFGYCRTEPMAKSGCRV